MPSFVSMHFNKSLYSSSKSTDLISRPQTTGQTRESLLGKCVCLSIGAQDHTRFITTKMFYIDHILTQCLGIQLFPFRVFYNFLELVSKPVLMAAFWREKELGKTLSTGRQAPAPPSYFFPPIQHIHISRWKDDKDLFTQKHLSSQQQTAALYLREKALF